MNNKFIDISSSPTTILSTGSKLNLCPLLVKDIIVYNKGTQNIKFNLRRERIENNPTTIFIINSPYAKTLFLRKFISSFIEAILAATNNLYLMAK